jgi:hypothetical protein
MLSPYPKYTKQTRCNNDLNLESKQDFFRPVISNVSTPLIYNHEHYIIDNHATSMHHLDMERSSISTRNNCTDSRKPVQSSFQNNYYTMNFETLNKYEEPTNIRKENIEKIRNNDCNTLFKNQERNIVNFSENTRKNKVDINSSNYIPMPRTMAIPKENI